MRCREDVPIIRTKDMFAFTGNMLGSILNCRKNPH